MIRRRLLVQFGRVALFFVCCTGLFSGFHKNLPAQSKTTAQAVPVKISINFGDGLVWTFDSIVHQPGMTVLEAMNTLKSRKNAPLAFEYQGSGQNAFLNSIGGVENQGGGRTDKNWFYRINDKLGNKSFGIAEVHPGDHVLWHFGKYEP